MVHPTLLLAGFLLLLFCSGGTPASQAAEAGCRSCHAVHLDPNHDLPCITCHKAQGSQFPRIIVTVRSSRLLDRTLLYTAITRAPVPAAATPRAARPPARGELVDERLANVVIVVDDAQWIDERSLQVLRYLAAWPSILFFGIGVLWAVFDKDRQFLHDRIAGTRIVFVDKQ